jgi:FtsH-binding integral membrane protein
MGVSDILFYVFAFLYGIWLPAFLLGKVLYPAQKKSVQTAIGLAMTLTVGPMLCFGLALLFRTNMSAWLMFSVSTAMIVTGIALRVIRMRKQSRELEE